LAGTDGYGDTAAISAATFSPGVPIAYLATGADFADALAGAAADGGHGPVLLVSPAGVPPAVATELQRLAPKKLVLLGGTSSVSDATAAEAAAAAGGVPLTRLAGADRYGTAAAVSAATFSPGLTIVYLATGANFPDALTGASAAGGRGPVLLVSPIGVPPATAAELQRLAPKKLVVLGGTSSVSEATAAGAAVTAGGVPTTRLAGADRYGTAAAISAATFSPGAGVVYLATGLAFPDALAGAAAAGTRGPVLLVTTGYLPDEVAAELRRLNAASTVVLGGTGAVGNTVATVADTITAEGIPAPSPLAPSAVAAAQAQLGKPYQWGGAGPDTFDCSGLTAWAWKAAGVTLVHNAATQWDQVADIPTSALQPGDLVFFGDPGVYHVGLYIGGSQMIEAAKTGTPVRVSSPWRPDLVGAGRPLP
jgi:cell wall-associated NlpC family hydrolase